MADAATISPAEAERIKRAVATCLAALTRHAPGQYRLDVLEHHEEWSDLRLRHCQHMLAWSRMTQMTIALDAAGNPIGWEIVKRGAGGGLVPLPDAAAEIIARTDPLVPANATCTKVLPGVVDEQTCCSSCEFALPDQPWLLTVRINPETHKLIGVLPVETPPLSPLTPQSPAVAKAEEHAWERITANALLQLGQEAADKVREALSLTLDAAAVDANGVQRCQFTVWTRFSTCDVALDIASTAVLGWSIDALHENADTVQITEQQATEAAQSELTVKAEVIGPEVSFDQLPDGNRTAIVHWEHELQAVPVAGDFVTVTVNAATGKVFGVSSKWREVPATILEGDQITSQQALEAVSRQRPQWGLPADAKGSVKGKAIIEVADEPAKPSPVRSCLVWRIGFKSPKRPGYTELSVECATGKVVHVDGW